MQLAKPSVDIAPTTAFCGGGAGAGFDPLLPLGPGQTQHRCAVRGSIIKVNHIESPPP